MKCMCLMEFLLQFLTSVVIKMMTGDIGWVVIGKGKNKATSVILRTLGACSYFGFQRQTASVCHYFLLLLLLSCLLRLSASPPLTDTILYHQVGRRSHMCLLFAL